MAASPNPNIIGVLRVSTDKQDVARQRTDMEKLKRKFDVNIVRVLELHGVSGTATLDNEQIKQVLNDLASPGIDGVGLSSLDRLFRPGKRYGQFAILDRFVDEGKMMWSVREGEIDPATDEGYDKCITAGGRAGAEWRELKRRTSDGKRETAEDGFLPHGNAKFGWDIIGRKQTGIIGKGKAVIHEKEAEIAREMFTLRRGGMSTYALAARLNEAGIRNKRGCNGQAPKPWTRTTILEVLRSTDYIGKHVWRGITIPIPPIVDEELFYAVQAAMQESGKRWVGRPSKLYLLRSFLWCGRCQHRCVGVRNRRFLAYRCGHISNQPPLKRLCDAGQVQAARLESEAWSAIWGLLKNPKLLLEMGRAHFAAKAKPHLSTVQKIDQQMARLKQKERNLENLMKEALTDEAYAGHRTDRNEVRARIAELEVQMRATGRVVNLPPLNALEAALREITSGPEPTTYERRRSILEGLIDLHMEYLDGDLKIEGQVPISEAEKNCYSGIDTDSNSFLAIPFTLKRRVA